MKKGIQDLPIYINGFTVSYLFMEGDMNIVSVIMFALSCISFFWYGRNEKSKNHDTTRNTRT